MDTISNLLSIIKNGYLAYKENVVCRNSKMTIAILTILKKYNFLQDFKLDKATNQITVVLKYQGKTPAMSDVKRVSKLGLRVYSGWKTFPKVQNGYGICIVSTSKGVMSASDARKLKVGGEIICKVW